MTPRDVAPTDWWDHRPVFSATDKGSRITGLAPGRAPRTAHGRAAGAGPGVRHRVGRVPKDGSRVVVLIDLQGGLHLELDRDAEPEFEPEGRYTPSE